VAAVNGQHAGLFRHFARWVRSSRVLNERAQNGHCTGFTGLPRFGGFVFMLTIL
jgi:hypothetical protein